eukprot:1465518-Amphidinium_carterae.1
MDSKSTCSGRNAHINTGGDMQESSSHPQTLTGMTLNLLASSFCRMIPTSNSMIWSWGLGAKN